jgi:hypothetical protein
MHNKQSRTVPFLIGSILGILFMIYLPSYVQPYLPESMTANESVVKGTVTAKEKKGDVLLLTVSTPEGALLATFKKKVDEVSLLINEKDEIQLTLPKYQPLIDDPKIVRVVKEQQAVPAPVVATAAPATPAEKNTKERKPRHQVKPQSPAPAPESAMEAKLPDRESSPPFAGDQQTGQ